MTGEEVGRILSRVKSDSNREDTAVELKEVGERDQVRLWSGPDQPPRCHRDLADALGEGNATARRLHRSEVPYPRESPRRALGSVNGVSSAGGRATLAPSGDRGLDCLGNALHGRESQDSLPRR